MSVGVASKYRAGVDIGVVSGRVRVIRNNFRLPPSKKNRLGIFGLYVYCDPELGGCGKVFLTNEYDFRNGCSYSCGCWREDRLRSTHFVHGLHGTVEYGMWKSIRMKYKDGHDVYEPWITDPKAFNDWVVETLGPKPDGHWLSRIDPSQPYEPGNLEYMTRSQITKTSNEYHGRV